VDHDTADVSSEDVIVHQEPAGGAGDRVDRFDAAAQDRRRPVEAGEEAGQPDVDETGRGRVRQRLEWILAGEVDDLDHLPEHRIDDHDPSVH